MKINKIPNDFKGAFNEVHSTIEVSSTKKLGPEER